MQPCHDLQNKLPEMISFRIYQLVSFLAFSRANAVNYVTKLLSVEHANDFKEGSCTVARLLICSPEMASSSMVGK